MIAAVNREKAGIMLGKPCRFPAGIGCMAILADDTNIDLLVVGRGGFRIILLVAGIAIG
jgi:hypothetical protein